MPVRGSSPDAKGKGHPTAVNRRAPLVRPAPLRHAVFDALVEMVVSGELQPGQHLVENDLAAQLGVSRQPIREALLRMHNDGWVDMRPSLGAFVHMPTDSEAEQLFDVRNLLEVESARLAARQATPEQVEHLHTLQRDGEKALADRDQDAMVSANAALHAYIAQMSGNKVLSDMIASVDRRVRWFYTAVVLTRAKDSWAEHAEIIGAISSQNSRLAGDLMRRHTGRTCAAYREYAEQRNSAAEASDA